MRVLVDISHPSQVHFFKNLILRFRRNKDKVLITAREKDVTIDLVRNLNLKYICLSRQKNGMLAMAWELIIRYIRMWAIVRRFKPDILIAETGVTVGLIGTILGIPRIVEEDTEHAKLQRMIGLPFVSIIMTGLGYLGNHGSRERKFKGVWVQSYLNPEYFTPDASILANAGIDVSKFFIVMRMVSWSAVHDTGLHGYDETGYLDIIRRLSKYGRVIISSEETLPESMVQYKNPVAPEQVHHLLAFAQLYIGEGATMAAEAAVLGTPAIFCNPLPLGYLQAMEKEYQLLYNCKSFSAGIEIAEKLLNTENLKQLWQQRRQKLLDESEDINEFMYKIVRELVRS
jgi:predicted glycosyltransferase